MVFITLAVWGGDGLLVRFLDVDFLSLISPVDLNSFGECCGCMETRLEVSALGNLAFLSYSHYHQ